MNRSDVYDDEGPASADEIAALEQALGVRFPKSYSQLISQHNGLVPSANIFSFLNEGRPDCRDVNFLAYGPARAGHSGQSEIVEAQDHDVYGHEQVIAFACAANGDFICFDYRHRRSDDPQIVLMLHDDVDESEKLKLIPVAPSFDQFMRELYKEP